MSDQHFKGNFLDRVERDVLRRNDVEHKALVHQDYSCTFHPQVMILSFDTLHDTPFLT